MSTPVVHAPKGIFTAERRTRSQLTLPDVQLPLNRSPLKDAKTALRNHHSHGHTLARSSEPPTTDTKNMDVDVDTESNVHSTKESNDDLSLNIRSHTNTRKRSSSPPLHDEYQQELRITSTTPLNGRELKRVKPNTFSPRHATVTSVRKRPAAATNPFSLHQKHESVPVSSLLNSRQPSPTRAQSVPLFPSSYEGIPHLDLSNPPVSPRRSRSKSPSRARARSKSRSPSKERDFPMLRIIPGPRLDVILDIEKEEKNEDGNGQDEKVDGNNENGNNESEKEGENHEKMDKKLGQQPKESVEEAILPDEVSRGPFDFSISTDISIENVSERQELPKPATPPPPATSHPTISLEPATPQSRSAPGPFAFPSSPLTPAPETPSAQRTSKTGVNNRYTTGWGALDVSFPHLLFVSLGVIVNVLLRLSLY